MKTIKKLPDAEFEIMKSVWQSEEPVTSPMLTEKLKITHSDKDWKPQTVMTMLVRLEKKGFLRSEKTEKNGFIIQGSPRRNIWRSKPEASAASFRAVPSADLSKR